MRLMLIAMAAILVATAAQAAKLSSGTYVMQGGSYSIGVAEQDGTLVVTEPNKTSVYTPAADGSYHFTNPNNGITYGLRIVDDRTIEAFKPGNPGGGSDAPRPERWRFGRRRCAERGRRRALVRTCQSV